MLINMSKSCNDISLALCARLGFVTGALRINNLHLRFQLLYQFCRQPRYFHHSRFIHALCQHLLGNLMAFLFHSFSNTFTLGGVYGILDVAIRYLTGLVLPQFLRSKLGNFGFLKEAVEDLVA